MYNAYAKQVSEQCKRLKEIFGIEDHKKTEDVHAYLAESERRRPEWLKERYRQMDEAMAAKRAWGASARGMGVDEEGGFRRAVAGGMTALTALGAGAEPKADTQYAYNDPPEEQQDTLQTDTAEVVKKPRPKSVLNDFFDNAHKQWDGWWADRGGRGKGGALGTRPKSAKNVQDAAKRTSRKRKYGY